MKQNLLQGCLYFAFGLAAVFLPEAAAQGQPDADLAQRFRPYLKTSLDGLHHEEQFKPITWQNFVRGSDFAISGNPMFPPMIVHTPTEWDVDLYNLVQWGGDLASNPPDMQYVLYPAATSALYGEDWTQAITGDGLYAHVVHLPPPNDRLINIDYTMLWSFNEDRSGFSIHYGDITFLIVLYDLVSDRIVRLTYPQHGCELELYELVPGQSAAITTVSGRPLTGEPNPFPVLQVNIDDDHEASDDRGDCTKGSFKAPQKYVLLAGDPKTTSAPVRFEHPLVYVENGTHESWPNRSGYVVDGGDHGGEGPSWLPGSASMLPDFDAPANADTPLLHFNGKIGMDGANFVLHRTWCWPARANNSQYRPCAHNSAGISDEVDGARGNRFSDMQPYEPKGKLMWPQNMASLPTDGDVYVVPKRQEGDGSAGKPFGGLDIAESLVPAAWTLHLAPGAYAATLLSKPMTISSSGDATISHP